MKIQPQRARMASRERYGKKTEVRSESFAMLYGLVGLMFVGIGNPLALQKVRPHAWYGFRSLRAELFQGRKGMPLANAAAVDGKRARLAIGKPKILHFSVRVFAAQADLCPA